VHLVAMVRRHRDSSEMALRAALHRLDAGTVARLAGAFATERLRQLAMQMPSGPIPMPEELREMVQQAVSA
jgi:hypothetical protein